LKGKLFVFLIFVIRHLGNLYCVTQPCPKTVYSPSSSKENPLHLSYFSVGQMRGSSHSAKKRGA